MKTVLISAYTCCPDRGSEPGNGWNWIMGYIRNGYTVHCVTNSLYTKEIEAFCRTNTPKGLTFHFINFNYSSSIFKFPIIGNYIHYYLWLFKARPVIKKITTKITFSHAHHVTYSSIKFGTPLYDLNIKIILGPLGGGALPHHSLKKYLGKNYYFEAFKFSLGNFLAMINPTVSWSIKSADRILVSNKIADNIIKKHSSINTIQMFDAGLADYFENEYKQRDLNGVVNILWIGRILPRKGLNLAIEAIANLPNDLDYHFYVVGDGPLKKAAEKTVIEYNLQHKVSFLGKLNHNLLNSVFEKSHLLLFPSLIDSCPMQVFESMAWGLPVVTLDHQGMKDQVTENTGIKISIKSGSNYPKLLANGILELIKDKDNYKKISANAYDFGQKQLWNKRIKQFINEL